MKKIFRNSLMMLAAGALAASCADYNDTTSFSAEADPSVVLPYTEYDAIKSYINKDEYPNLTLGATLDVTEFNKQELVHSAAMGNFDNFAFGNTLMSGKIINEKGIMNFISLIDLLEHMEEVGGEVFGSPLVANANQADGWLRTLTAPIEIAVEYVPGKTVDYNTYSTGGNIVKYDGQNVLQVGTGKKVKIIEGFDVNPDATYTVTFWAKSDKDASFNIEFSGKDVAGTATSDGKWKIPAGKWTKVVVESKVAEGATEGYLQINNTRTAAINIQKVEAGYYPDNHRSQTEQEKTDTINYALNAWIDRFMEINDGRIKSFDLIDEPIGTEADATGIYDLKHSTSESTIFWQDVLGSENYAPVVSKLASTAFEKYNGDPAELKFYISETGLENKEKMKSLKHWIDIWTSKGAKIDGINAKVNLIYYENETKRAENQAAYETLLQSLASTGKLIRISNFDIKYVNASGASVTPSEITKEQRQQLADYNAYAIKTYMNKIPKDKQAGICKSNIVDTKKDPVGLWSEDSKTKDWVRNANYKAWCEALRGN